MLNENLRNELEKILKQMEISNDIEKVEYEDDRIELTYDTIEIELEITRCTVERQKKMIMEYEELIDSQTAQIKHMQKTSEKIQENITNLFEEMLGGNGKFNKAIQGVSEDLIKDVSESIAKDIKGSNEDMRAELEEVKKQNKILIDMMQDKKNKTLLDKFKDLFKYE